MVKYCDDMTTVLERQEAMMTWKRKSDHLNAHLFINSSTHQQQDHGKCDDEDENKRNKKKKTSHSNSNSNSNSNNNNKKKGVSSNSNSNSVTEYIHVRARRGEATDSHSLAERVRREKISERMKYLQDLVPGCNKITGKAGMLDEIINYVQSLQRQVQFLSMKLATFNPTTLNHFNLHHLFSKQVVGDEGCGPSLMMNNVAAVAACVEQTVSSPSSGLLLDHLIHLHNHHPHHNINMDVNLINPNLTPNPPSHLPLPTTINSIIPETFLHSPTFPQILPSSTWEYDFQDLSNVGFDDQAPAPTSFSSFPFTDIVEVTNPKMELEM